MGTGQGELNTSRVVGPACGSSTDVPCGLGHTAEMGHHCGQGTGKGFQLGQKQAFLPSPSGLRSHCPHMNQENVSLFLEKTQGQNCRVCKSTAGISCCSGTQVGPTWREGLLQFFS